VTVSGTQSYIVKYHLANVMNPFPDHAEFFYNVFLGDSVPKDRVKVTVTGPGGVTSVRCVRGSDPGRDCDSAQAGQTAVFTVDNLLGNEDLTIATSLPRAGFGELKPDIRAAGSSYDEGQAKVLTSLALAGGIGAPLVAAGVMGVLVATRGRDEWYAGVTPGLSPGSADAAAPGTVPPPPPTPILRGRRPEIAVQFNPPPGVQPGMVGTIIDESADTIDVSATVMDLAVRGFLRIEEIQSGTMFSRTDWRLVQLPPPPGQTLRPYEATVLEGLFAEGSDVKLSDLKYKFNTTLNLAIRQMYTEVVERGWFRRSPLRQRAGWQALGFLLIGAGAVSCFYLGVVTRAIDRTGGFGVGIPRASSSGWGSSSPGSSSGSSASAWRPRPRPGRRCMRSRSASASTSRPPRRTRSGSRRRRPSSAGTCRTRSSSASPTGGRARSRRWPKRLRRRARRSSCRPGTSTAAPCSPTSRASPTGPEASPRPRAGRSPATASSGSSGGSAFGGGGFSGGGGVGGSSSGSW
jgi:hypothetical protein